MYAWCVGRCTKMMGFLFLFRSITTRINHHNAHPFQSHPFHFFCSTIEKISFHVFISFSFTFHLASYRTKKIKISFYNYYFKIQYVCMHTYHACVRIYIYIYKKTGKMSTCMQVDVLTVANRQSIDHLWVVDTLPVGHFTGRKSGLHFAEKISSRRFAGKIQSTLCRRYHFSSRHFGSRHFGALP